MFNPNDFHAVSDNTIADQIRVDGWEFAKVAGSAATTLGEIRQAVTGAFQAVGDLLGGGRAIQRDVISDRCEVRDRLRRPDYLSHDAGAGFSSGVPQVSSHAATSA